MADINVERKSSTAWIWWLLALLAIALIAWLLLAGDDEEEVTAVDPAPVVAPVGDAPPPQPVAQGPLTLADVIANPGANIGSTVTSAQAVRVAEAVSDRGFWIEENGARMFVVLNESAPGAPNQADVEGRQAEKPVLRSGDMIQITEAIVHDGTQLQNLQPPLDEQTRQVASGQQAFLVTDGRNVRKM